MLVTLMKFAKYVVSISPYKVWKLDPNLYYCCWNTEVFLGVVFLLAHPVYPKGANEEQENFCGCLAQVLAVTSALQIFGDRCRIFQGIKTQFCNGTNQQAFSRSEQSERRVNKNDNQHCWIIQSYSPGGANGTRMGNLTLGRVHYLWLTKIWPVWGR